MIRSNKRNNKKKHFERNYIKGSSVNVASLHNDVKILCCQNVRCRSNNAYFVLLKGQVSIQASLETALIALDDIILSYGPCPSESKLLR